MKWSFSLGKVAGIDVRIHVTFFLLLAFYGWIHGQEGGWPAAWAGMGFILLLFLCVLLHEFGHALAARAFGIHTPDITLLPIGGVARLERMPRDPFQELIIAVAGPAVNVVIALILFFVLGKFVDWRDMISIAEGSPGQLLLRLLAVNIWLVLFNCLPAFPMDGGRILRAFLAMILPHSRATLIAGRVGQVMAALFGIGGIYSGNMILLLIAVFVFMGAQQEIQAAQLRSAMPRHAKVRDAMVTRFTTLPAEARLEQILPVIWQSAQSFFPVVTTDLSPCGILFREETVRQQDAQAREIVRDLCKSVPLLQENDLLESALDLLQQNGTGLGLVCNLQGQLVGLLLPALLLERTSTR